MVWEATVTYQLMMSTFLVTFDTASRADIHSSCIRHSVRVSECRFGEGASLRSFAQESEEMSKMSSGCSSSQTTSK